MNVSQIDERIRFIDQKEYSSIEKHLDGFGQEYKELLTDANKDIEISHGDGTFWDPIELAGIYLVIKELLYKSEFSRIIQIAGGHSPILYAISRLHPETYGKLIGLDLDQYYNIVHNDIPYMGINYICEDALHLGRLKLKKPAIVFSYNLLCVGYLREQKITEIVTAVTSNLPPDSIFIFQVGSRIIIPAIKYETCKQKPEKIFDYLSDPKVGKDNYPFWKCVENKNRLRNKILVAPKRIVENSSVLLSITIASRIK